MKLPPFSLTSLEAQQTASTRMMDAWWSLGQVMKRHVVPVLEREHNMDFGDFMVLSAIDRGANYPTELCSLISIPASGISRMLENLTKLEIVKRTLDTEDSRRVRIEITPKGYEALKAARETMLGMIEQGLATLPIDQVDSFIDTMMHLSATIAKTRETA